MNIALVSGGYGVNGGTSQYLLEHLKKEIGPQHEIVEYSAGADNISTSARQIAALISECDALVIAFSLYVDAIPAHLLEILQATQTACSNQTKTILAYPLVSNGFFEAEQNQIAVDIFWKWCEACGVTQGCALCVGGGPMSKVLPMGHGPCTTLGKMLHRLAESILTREQGQVFFSSPDFPRVLYQLMGNVNWLTLARKNGLPLSRLRQKGQA